jgi:hypothetical protein
MATHLEVEEFVAALQSHLGPRTETSLLANGAQVEEIEEALCSPEIILVIHGDRAGQALPTPTVAGGSRSATDALADDLHIPRKVNVSILNRKAERKQDAEVVVDEFDEIANERDRGNFAKFVEQIADRRVPIHFVLSDVSQNLKELLGVHESSYSYAESALPASEKSVVSKLKDASERTPHYVHLVSEQLFWEMLNEPTFARSLR